MEGALVTERLSKENVDRLIGDHLKRAPRAEDKNKDAFFVIVVVANFFNI